MTSDGRADRLGIFRKFERKYYDLFKKGTIMSEKEQEKYKITVRMNEKTKAEIDEMMGEAHTGSVNACINKAIECYPDNITVHTYFHVSDKNIRFGLLALKNLGKQLVDSVIYERGVSRFVSFDDFAERMAG